MGKPSKGGGNGGNSISGNKRDNTLNGTNASETINGKGGDDTIFGGGGNDTIIGGSGMDTALFAFARDDYDVTLLADGRIQVSGPEGVDVVSGVEIFQFADINQSAAEVIMPREANLSVGALVVEDTVLSPGEVTTVSVDIASDGVIDAGASVAELVFATAPDAGAIAGSLGSVDLAALAAGNSQTLTVSLDPGTLAPGTYWVAVRADAAETVDESDETDNLTDWVQITVEAPVADLVLASAGVGAGSDLDLEGGARIDIDYVVENASNTDVSYFSAATYLSTDASISTDDLRIAGATGGTYPGLTTPFTTSHYLPEGFAAGDYYLISVIEWGDGTPDATPENNVIVNTVSLVAPPPPTVDLAVTQVAIDAGSDFDLGPDGYYWEGDGARLDLAIDLANLGAGDAVGAGLTAYLSTDGTVSADDIAIWTGTVDLAATAETTLSISAEVGALVAAGDYQVIVVADAAEDIDAGNDVGSAAVTLIGSLDPDAGTEGDDVWVSGPGSDVVFLLEGDDVAIAGGGNDRVDGGDGFDTIDLSGATQGMDVYFGDYEGYDLATAPWATEMPFSTWVNFEHVILTDFDDYASLAGSMVTELDLGGGNDTAEGSFGSDVINAGSGDDFISGLLGNDTLTTGDGFDFVAIARDTSTGVATGFDHDSVEDFDVLADTILIAVSTGDAYDPFNDLVQTAQGALLEYADGSSLLLRDVDLADLTQQHFEVVENFGSVFA